MAGRTMSKTTLYLPAEVQSRLKSLAKATGKSQAEVIRRALEEYLSKAKRPQPTSIGVGDDAELNARDTTDWLKENWRP